MPTDGETSLAALETDLASDAHAGLIAMDLGALAASQWSSARGASDDWPGIYNMWLLQGEEYRLRSFWHGSPAATDFRSRRGSVPDLLKYAAFGIWCDLWDRPALVASARKWCQLELEALSGPIGPSASVVESFVTGRLPADAADQWSAIRRKFSRGGLNRPPVHNDAYPYDAIAPELAWSRKAGQVVPALSAITDFPPFREWPVTSVTERALIALGSSPWA